MRNASCKIPSVRDGAPVLISVERGAVATVVERDHETVLHCVHGSGWAIAHGVTDLVDVVDAATGAWRLLGGRG